jgi:DNA-3-methyladenine glycosylase
MSSPDGVLSSVPGDVPGSVPGEVPGRVPGRDWYARPVLDVARDLLGATLTTRTSDGVVSLRLTEVEAYAGAGDPGSHAYRGRSRRNATMFGEPGRLYVYRHLGLHHCVNVVCGPEDTASAVLVRAGEVVEGADLARSRRLASGVVRADRDLARGPARLAVALGLDLSHDGGARSAGRLASDGRVASDGRARLVGRARRGHRRRPHGAAGRRERRRGPCRPVPLAPLAGRRPDRVGLPQGLTAPEIGQLWHRHQRDRSLASRSVN